MTDLLEDGRHEALPAAPKAWNELSRGRHLKGPIFNH